ncbi:MAG: DoxX family protein [Armatimonadetes bacterium]|nr:DoxX family protein [Armatimonadota bacterium]
MEGKGTGNIALLVLRLGLGAIMVAHGAQKVFGLWGGSGFTQTVENFQGMGIMPVLAYLAMAAELLGGLALIIGLLGRVAAFGIAIVMIVGIFKVHWANGFFQANGGFEYPLALLAIAIALMISGMGSLSVDAALSKRSRSGPERG